MKHKGNSLMMSCGELWMDVPGQTDKKTNELKTRAGGEEGMGQKGEKQT